MSDTIPARLFAQAEKRPGSPAYFEKIDGTYRPTSWSEYAASVRRAARALIALGFEPGQHVAILGFNRPEWVILDVAAMTAGGAPAGIYTTCSPEEVPYIIHHAEAPVILVENEAQLDEGARGAWQTCRSSGRSSRCAARPSVDDARLLAWDEFLAKGDGADDAEARRARRRDRARAASRRSSTRRAPPVRPRA